MLFITTTNFLKNHDLKKLIINFTFIYRIIKTILFKIIKHKVQKLHYLLI